MEVINGDIFNIVWLLLVILIVWILFLRVLVIWIMWVGLVFFGGVILVVIRNFFDLIVLWKIFIYFYLFI